MKKLIYVLLAALTLAACSLDDPKIVIKDQLVLKKLSLNALDQLGKDQKVVSEAVLDLGFKEVVEKKELPAFLRKPAYNNEKLTVRTFSYNAPEDMTFEDLIRDTLPAEKVQFFNKIADSRKVFIIAYVCYDADNIVRNVQGLLFAGREVADINNLYRNFSNNVYSTLGYVDINEDKSWNAELTDDGLTKHEYDANERKAFLADFEKVVYPEVSENGDDVRAKMERKYMMSWTGNAEIKQEGIKPLCGGMFYAYY